MSPNFIHQHPFHHIHFHKQDALSKATAELASRLENDCLKSNFQHSVVINTILSCFSVLRTYVTWNSSHHQQELKLKIRLAGFHQNQLSHMVQTDIWSLHTHNQPILLPVALQICLLLNVFLVSSMFLLFFIYLHINVAYFKITLKIHCPPLTELIPWFPFLLGKSTVALLLKKFPTFYGTWITALYPELDESSPYLPCYISKIYLILSLDLHLYLLCGNFTSGVRTITLYAVLSYPMFATCPAPTNLLDFIILITFSKDYRLWSSSLCNFLHPPIIYHSFIYLYIPLIHTRLKTLGYRNCHINIIH
jgi:hypothetical protein